MDKQKLIKCLEENINDIFSANYTYGSYSKDKIIEEILKLIGQSVEPLYKVVDKKIGLIKYLEDNKLFESRTDDLDETSCPMKGAEYYDYITKEDLINAINKLQSSPNIKVEEEKDVIDIPEIEKILKATPLETRLEIAFTMDDYGNWCDGEYEGDKDLIKKYVESAIRIFKEWQSQQPSK